MTREEAIDCLEGLKIYLKTEHIDQEALDMAIEALKELPKRRKEAKRWKTKALQAVKHGEWIDHGTTCQRYECSVCGDQHDWLILPNNINFCPNCGAKMDKEIEDNGTE